MHMTRDEIKNDPWIVSALMLAFETNSRDLSAGQVNALNELLKTQPRENFATCGELAVALVKQTLAGLES